MTKAKGAMAFDDFVGWCLMAVTVGSILCAMVWLWRRVAK